MRVRESFFLWDLLKNNRQLLLSRYGVNLFSLTIQTDRRNNNRGLLIGFRFDRLPAEPNDYGRGSRAERSMLGLLDDYLGELVEEGIIAPLMKPNVVYTKCSTIDVPNYEEICVKGLPIRQELHKSVLALAYRIFKKFEAEEPLACLNLLDFADITFTRDVRPWVPIHHSWLRSFARSLEKA